MRRTLVPVVVATLLCLAQGVPVKSSGRPANQFPDGFYLGAATAAYQIEGAWNEDGKGESIWDHMLHTKPNATSDGQNGDVAADSYHKYKEDVQLLVGINANVYRFSLSWPRILPTGDTDNINQAGIDYYNNLINELLANGIEPMITLYHWDLPQELQKLGGWPNIELADYFVEYARIAFENFGDRVKLWLTFNEPNMFSKGYSGASSAPAANSSGIADYLMAKTILLAHARVYRLYDLSFRFKQRGKVGITLDGGWYEPLTNSAEDADASDRQLQFEVGLWANPIFSLLGDFPKVVRQRVAANSRQEGRTRSRLPSLSLAEILLIRGTSDFFGLNHYTTSLITSGSSGVVPSKTYDAGVVTSTIEGYNTNYWISDVPWGLRKLLNWVHKSYPGYPIFVTENGWVDPPGILNDTGRVHYLRGYISAILRAINEDGVPMIGYTHWSLIDNLEWIYGYSPVSCGVYGELGALEGFPQRVRREMGQLLWWRGPATLRFRDGECDAGALLSETWGVPLSFASSPRAPNHFPDGFYLGAATAAYQIEGGWNEDGKGESIWDHMLHAQPNLTSDGQNGDVAADSYHKYNEDVKLLVGLNANVYRFSLRWPRILPTGDTDNINQAGIDYYNNLINELLANGIQPMVTLYHWDLPQELQKLGGWPNAVIADYFVEFARIAFENFGDRVKSWCGLWAHPIFSREGDFPEVVKLRVAANCRKEGRTRSRLPALSPAEVNLIRGTADFFGINHYSSSLVTSGSSGSEPSKTYDSGVVTSMFEGYPTSFWISEKQRPVKLM
ncbi:myrosinase 1-like [Schistocerca serialis cubense]|uniref:myrosinase 1-like n=1 Tax=Schistocerca serialis cubense TaxID=2023355 RepID=UPI00214F2F20|nr:myrosinase 1-like [Schistocerca serialis cubense]